MEDGEMEDGGTVTGHTGLDCNTRYQAEMF